MISADLRFRLRDIKQKHMFAYCIKGMMVCQMNELSTKEKECVIESFVSNMQNFSIGIDGVLQYGYNSS